MSSGPCQKPALANACRSARPPKRGSLWDQSHRDDAAFFFIRPCEHQLRSVHRLLVEHAHLGDFVVVVLIAMADIRLGARRRRLRAAAPRRSTATSSEIAMPSARRVPDAEVLESSMTGRLSDAATRASRTTLISGSGPFVPTKSFPPAGPRAWSRSVRGRPRRPRHHSKPAMPAMNNTPAIRRMRRSSGIVFTPSPGARPRRRPPPRGARRPARSW